MPSSSKYSEISFLCGSRDFHAMDWYRSALSCTESYEISITTDMIESEGVRRLLTDSDRCRKLIIIDGLLFRTPGRKADIWRNILKMAVLPLQAIILRHQNRRRACFYHAHAMYYAMLAWLAGVDYIATPQGSEILRRAETSALYGFFAGKALRSAKFVTVDSERMADIIFQKYGIEAKIIQNGIDVTSILESQSNRNERERIVSVRGMTSLYAIEEILEGRRLYRSDVNITFIYPFFDNDYLTKMKDVSNVGDQWLGRLNRAELYGALKSAQLVISIPRSDSSPRSVYESVFCGAAVAVRENSYLNRLPQRIRERIIVVDTADPNWFEFAMTASKRITDVPFEPDEESLLEFDQIQSFKKILTLIQSV